MLMNLAEKFDKFTSRLSKKFKVENHEEMLGYCIGIILCFMIWVFMTTNSLGVSIVVGMALSVIVFYVMFYRILHSYQKDIEELRQQIAELKTLNANNIEKPTEE